VARDREPALHRHPRLPGQGRVPRPGTMFAALAVPNFRLYLAGQAISLTGTWMQVVAQSWLVLQLTGSGALLGLVAAAQFLPVLLLGPYGGLVADRAGKRRLLMGTQSVLGVLALVLGLLTVTHVVRLWMVFVLAVALGTVNSVDQPTRQTFVPEMVGRERLQNAVSLNSVMTNAARAIGPAVAGVLREAGGDHFCTASVVASPGRDLLITAAHCINSGKGGSYRQGIVFIPDYRDGQAPFGIWTVKRLLVAPQWISGSDPSLDVGFVTLEPHDGQNIEDVLGANQLGTDSGYQDLVRVTGYPASADAPITCVNWTSRQSASQLRFECGGFTGGTSGSPWVTHFDPRTHSGTIVGVIGGYQEGGDTAAISYSSYLGAEVQRLYQEAIADQPPAAG
jgi:V8-like Glu-specific endopeptidase